MTDHALPEPAGEPATFDGASPVVAKLAELAAEAGIRRVNILAWRDLEDPEAGGSEVHAAMVAKHWAQAGLEVTMRTSFAAGRPPVAWRDGYRVIRKAGRYLVFPRAAIGERLGRHGRGDALVEVWNGMPFFSPVWSRTPHITVIHHLHAEMWDMTLPPRLARLGRFIESRLAPPLYHGTRIVTPSESSAEELVRELHLRADRVTVVHNGVDPRFTTGSTAKWPTPFVIAVGRLVPVKRLPELVDVLARVKERHPALEAVIVGDGYERDRLRSRVHERRAESWLHLPGYVSDEDLVELYRRAWVVASASAREGWGMAITEAAACGTPAVASRTVGHLDTVVDGTTGLLGDSDDELVELLDRVIAEEPLRGRLARSALDHAARFSWGATALGIFEVLAEAARSQHRGGR